MGCGASAAQKGEGAPSLNQFFLEFQKYTDEELVDLMKYCEEKDQEKLEAMKAMIRAKREAFDKVAARLLKESFDHHDISGDGVLSEEESKRVFEHIVEEKSERDATMAKSEQRRIMAAELGLQRGFFKKEDIKNEEEVQKGAENIIKEDFKAKVGEIEERMKRNLADYRANKAERDKVAFEVMDTSNDGRIVKKEFLAAFEAGSELNKKLMAALGLNIELEDK